MHQIPPKKPQSGSEQNLVEQEAMVVARSLQRPGQTKEQTKLIAQGIAKGIEQYKKQQSAKARERDKARKRWLRQKTAESATSANSSATAPESGWMANRSHSAPLRVGGTLFTIFALIHLARLLGGWSLSLGPWNVPAGFSVAAVLVLAALAAWFFRCAADPHCSEDPT